MKINQGGNLIGRVGALAVIASAVIGLGRLCGMNGVCPFAGGPCPLAADKAQK